MLSVNAQVDPRDGRHIFNYNVTLTRCNPDGTMFVPPPAAAAPTPAPTAAAAVARVPIPSGPQTIEKNTIFTITSVIGGDYIIKIETFTSGSTRAALNNKTFVRDENGQNIYYKMPLADYNSNAARLEKKGTFTVGASTTLIKIRPGKKEPKDDYVIYSDFGNDFNIGVSAGWKFKPYRRLALSHSFVGGLSFSSIKVTPYTTRNFVESEATQACVTFSAGYVFEYDKFQVTGFAGLDVMSGEVGRNWIYRNRPWLGLGFGYQIFRAQGETGN